jgi:acetyl-CoA carboxylase carboxyl transferase subunit alpha
MVKRQLDYEQKHQQLGYKIKELKELSAKVDFDLSAEIESLEAGVLKIKKEKYQNLNAWEKVLLSRHPDRASSRDYIESLSDEWLELHGDRYYGDDRAVTAGIALFNGQPITVLGYQKGEDTQDNIAHNFGMPHPEGYRKILRLLLQAEKFDRPVVTFIDTPGAYPGIGAEERGQAWAISQVLMILSALKVPVVAIVTGEGGSGGALALAVADRTLMFSNAVFSVATPEACSSILWNDLERVEEMASALKITAADLLELGIIDEIIEEPPGGINEDFEASIANIRKSLQRHLEDILSKDREELLVERYSRLRKIGKFTE